MDKLNTCYDPQAAMDFSQGRGSDAARSSRIRQGARQKGVPLPVGTPVEDPSPERGGNGGHHAAWRRWSAFGP